ncbi:MAG: replication initiator protein [Microviridae sp.]|nr:MAG: replication initiator protein [Microviridae sp.]
MDKANQWGLRCLHEKKMWKWNFFATLTYDDESLPPGGTLCLRDVQLFMKKLRFAKNSTVENPVRFFLAGEYGDVNKRPHYHALLFNCPFTDLVRWSSGKRGEPLYTSRELSELWGKGHCSLGEVTYESAVYCAKYGLKKLKVNADSPPAIREEYERRYVVYDADGVVYERVPEFAVMSRRPGIGADYYNKYGKEVRDHDSVVVSGRKVRPPRFYDGRSEVVDPERFEELKAARKREAVKEVNKADNTPERLRVKEEILKAAEKRKERNL